MYVLKDLFGDCPHVKIIEVLAENAGFDISRPEIHSEIGGSKTTVYSHIKRLLKGGFVQKTRKVGRTQLYSLNLNDPRARLVVFLENQIVTGRLEETMGRLGIPPIPEVKPVRALPDFGTVFEEPEIESFHVGLETGSVQDPYFTFRKKVTIVLGTVEPFAEEALAEEALAEEALAEKVRAARAVVGHTTEWTPLEPAFQNAA